MSEFLIEVDGKTFSGRYHVHDDLSITVTIAGYERRASLVEMKAAKEAIVLAKRMIKDAATDLA